MKYDNAMAVVDPRAAQRLVDAGLTAMRRAIIALGPSGTILTATALAHVWLRRYFGWRGGPTLPPGIIAWLSAPTPAAAGGARSIPADGGHLMITVAREQDGTTLLLLRQEQDLVDSRRLASLGLSPRETDTLFWVAQGKADAEIAVILGLSVRTVQHHVGRLLAKLGAESRTAAAAVAHRVLRA